MLWERELLSQIGFALTLDKCNATGSTEELVYISPKTGHAICKNAGEPYKSKLLPMPKIWQNTPDFDNLNLEEIKPALNVLEYFFNKHIYQEKNKTIPYIRRNLTE